MKFIFRHTVKEAVTQYPKRLIRLTVFSTHGEYVSK